MPLKLGQWDLNVAGGKGFLLIKSVGENGVVDGLVDVEGLSGPVNVTGMWDEVSARLTLAPIEEFAMFFEAYLCRSPLAPPVGQDVKYTLTGTVDVIRQTAALIAWGGNKRRSRFGWFAQIDEVA